MHVNRSYKMTDSAATISLKGRDEFNTLLSELDQIKAKKRQEAECIEKERRAKEAEEKRQSDLAAKEKVEKEKKEKLEQEPIKQEVVTTVKPTATATATATLAVPLTGKVVVVDPIADSFVDQLKAAKDLIAQVEQLKLDPQLKEVRTRCLKLVMHAMNLCSSNSKSIHESAGEVLQALARTNGIINSPDRVFLIGFLASQFLEQADTQIERNPRSAWAFGALLNIMATTEPDSYRMVISIILLNTPTAIPIFHPTATSINGWVGSAPPKRSELTSKETSRIISVCKLYWASLVQGDHSDALWRIWARILQCDLPVGLIMVPSLINLTGNYMMRTFPQQCPKLVYFLRTKSFATWKSMVSKKNATEEERLQFRMLEIVLEDNAKLGGFPVPDGQDMNAAGTQA
eukprot:GHVH01000358.1.p2 GENE.GHVH01000358.1~~GHVH01000358.1.p2  ORF type:complete len:403 (+),score=58.01 GHVH01000358.1:1098-2306(+)